jgi:hypothetical protein
LVAGLVAEADELIGAHGDGGVGLAMVVAEFYFKYTFTHPGFEILDYGSDLAAEKALGRQVFEERDDRNRVGHARPLQRNCDSVSNEH